MGPLETLLQLRASHQFQGCYKGLKINNKSLQTNVNNIYKSAKVCVEQRTKDENKVLLTNRTTLVIRSDRSVPRTISRPSAAANSTHFLFLSRILVHFTSTVGTGIWRPRLSLAILLTITVYTLFRTWDILELIIRE